jgi:hypothetical protein
LRNYVVVATSNIGFAYTDGKPLARLAKINPQFWADVTRVKKLLNQNSAFESIGPVWTPEKILNPGSDMEWSHGREFRAVSNQSKNCQQSPCVSSPHVPVAGGKLQNNWIGRPYFPESGGPVTARRGNAVSGRVG